MRKAIALPLRNFEMTMLVSGIIPTIVSWSRMPRAKRNVREELLAYSLLFSSGFGFLSSGIVHTSSGPWWRR